MRQIKLLLAAMVTAFVFTAGAWAQVYHNQQYAVLVSNSQYTTS